MGVDLTEGDTAETNYTVLKVFGKDGYKIVSYYAPNPNHFSVRIAKWLNGCPFPAWYIKMKFLLSKLYMKTRYRIDFKKGRVKRFGI